MTKKDEELKRFWDGTKTLLNKIENLIAIESEILNKKHIYLWTKEDPSVTKKPSGILIPTSYIDHKLIYIGYEAEFIDAFSTLFTQINKNKGNTVSEFAIRTLYELAFPRSQLLFDKNIDKKVRDRYRLILVLADYGQMSFNNKKRFSHFKRLINSERHLFVKEKYKKDLSLYDFYKKIVEAVEKQKRSKHIRLCKEARKLITKYQGDIFRNKSKIIKTFNKKNIDALYWSFSHLLHGNLLLLIDLFSNKRPPNRGKLKNTWALLQCGINLTHFVSEYLDNPKIIQEAKNLKVKFKKISKFISENYKKVEE